MSLHAELFQTQSRTSIICARNLGFDSIKIDFSTGFLYPSHEIEVICFEGES
jgi:hypothetical protein